MKIIRFYATDDGGSRFMEIEVPINTPQKDADGYTLMLSNTYISPSVRFVELPQGMSQTWHNAPQRQIVVILSGVLEVGTTDNQTRRWKAGETFLADDVTGRGHTTRTIGGPAKVFFAPLPDGFEIESWSV